MTLPPARPDPLAAHRVPSSAAPTGGVTAWYAEGLSDALGDRLLLFDTTGPGLELLRIDSRVAGLDGFEGALRATVESLRDFTHPSFARVRAVTWLDEPQPKLALVSEIVPGERLSNVLHAARVSGRRPDPAAVVSLLRQLLPALAALHAHGGAAHGLLAADRIVVTPDGELVITEHAIGAAVDAAAGTDEALRQRLGLPAEGSDSVARTRHDVLQVGRLAVSMLLGRTARATGPEAWGEALDQATRIWGAALPPPLRAWLSRALALDRAPFHSARDAQDALERLLPASGHLAPALQAGGSSAPLTAPDRSALPPSAASDVRTAPLPRAVISEPQPPALPERAHVPVPAAAATERPTPPPPVPSKPPALPSLFAGPLKIEQPATRRTWTTRRLTGLRLAAAGLAAVALLEAAVLVSILTGGGGAAAPAAQALVSAPHASADAEAAVSRAARGAPRRTSVRSPDGRSAKGAVVAAAMAGSLPLRDADDATKQATLGDSPVIGWINVAAPSRVRVYANGRLLGATRASSFRLPPGDHQIAIVDEATGRRTNRSVRIVAGRTLRLSIDSFE